MPNTTLLSLRPTTARLAAVAGAVLMLSCASRFEPDRTATAPVLDGFGTPTLAASTDVPAAQRLFAQGVAQAYAFNEEEAVRAFKAALAQDPQCALCAWGVAWQLGPTINAPARGALDEAQRYVQLAQRGAARATPQEQALIEAMAIRYGRIPSPPVDAPLLAVVCGSTPTERADPLDVAYAARMRALSDAAPDDPDLASLYAEAAMVATPADFWDLSTNTAAGALEQVAERLQHAIARAPQHTGAHHYLVHALDRAPSAVIARSTVEASADVLGRLAPASPHLVHMPSHIYVRIGRYDDAAQVNQQALAAELRLTSAITAQGFKPGFDWNAHNLRFLWFAALMEGRGDVALDAARRAAALADKDGLQQEFVRSLPLFTLARLERWDDVLKEPAARGDKGLASAMADQARGIAFARTGRLAEAHDKAAALQRALTALQATPDSDEVSFQRKLLAILHGRLEAELSAAEGRASDAAAQQQAVVVLEDGLGAMEPPLLAAGTRTALGDLLLKTKQWPQAEAAMRDDLARQPGNGWALRGLRQALAAQGRADEANAVGKELERAWRSADPALKTAAL